MTESRLHTRLEPTFTDYSINKYKPNYNGKKKVYVKIYDSGIKGDGVKLDAATADTVSGAFTYTLKLGTMPAGVFTLLATGSDGSRASSSIVVTAAAK